MTVSASRLYQTSCRGISAAIGQASTMKIYTLIVSENGDVSLIEFLKGYAPIVKAKTTASA